MTAQFHENLIINGEETTMAFCPPLPNDHPRIVALSSEEIKTLLQNNRKNQCQTFNYLFEKTSHGFRVS